MTIAHNAAPAALIHMVSTGYGLAPAWRTGSAFLVDGQPHRYHHQTMASLYEFVFVYWWWGERTAHLFGETKRPICIKSYTDGWRYGYLIIKIKS